MMGPGKAVVEREQPCPGVEMGEGGPGKAVVEVEQPCSGVEMGAGGPGKAVVEMEQPCSGVDMPNQQVLEEVFYFNFFLMLLNVIMQVSRRKYGTSGDERNVVE